MQERQVQSPVQEDSLVKKMVVQSSILAGEIPWTEESDGATVHGVAKNGESLSDWAHHRGGDETIAQKMSERTRKGKTAQQVYGASWDDWSYVEATVNMLSSGGTGVEKAESWV